MEQTYMKEKPIFPLLLSMAVPMILSMLVNSLYNIIDSIFVAKISEDAMTALSLVYPVQNLISSIGVGFGIGVNAVIAMSLGAKKQEDADAAAAQGLFLSVIHGALYTIFGILVMPAFLKMFTDSSEIVDLGLRYSRIVLSFSIIITMEITFEKIFQSVGRMVVSMISMLSGCIINIVLDPILIFGMGIFPTMGIRGAAWATNIGQLATLIIYLIVWLVRPLNIKLSIRNIKPTKEICPQLYMIGIPATLNMGLPSLLVSALNAILASFSQSYILVILGIYYKLQTFLYLPANGIIQGMRPLLSYNYGAREFERVKKDLPNRPFAYPADHDTWHGTLPDHPRMAHRIIYRKSFYNTTGNSGAAHHQSGIYRFLFLHCIRRCTGSFGKRAKITDHYQSALCNNNHTCRFPYEPDFRSLRRMVRILHC